MASSRAAQIGRKVSSVLSAGEPLGDERVGDIASRARDWLGFETDSHFQSRAVE